MLCEYMCMNNKTLWKCYIQCYYSMLLVFNESVNKYTEVFSVLVFNVININSYKLFFKKSALWDAH